MSCISVPRTTHVIAIAVVAVAVALLSTVYG
jgi:hypothetical protein